MSGTTKIKPIDTKLKPLLEEFLLQENLQETFLFKARKLGYTGSDPDKIKVALFTPDMNNEICFADAEISNLFTEFQIRKQVFSVEPYKTLLAQKPEVEPELLRISKSILNGDDVDVNSILDLFPKETE